MGASAPADAGERVVARTDRRPGLKQRGTTRVVDRRRHVMSARRSNLLPDERPRGLPQVYRGRARKGLADIYDTDHAERLQGGRFRWLISTCLAGGVGLFAIGVIIYGAADPREGADGFLPALDQLRSGTAAVSGMPSPRRQQGLAWSVPKTDRLQITTGATSTRFIIHETMKQKRGGREYIHAKPYMRVVARLAPVPDDYGDVIPPFNPFKLYANSRPITASDDAPEGTGEPRPGERSDVSIRVVELLGGILPGEDGQELETSEVAELIERSQQIEGAAATQEAILDPDADTPLKRLESVESGLIEATPPNTTVLPKTTRDADDAALDDYAGAEQRAVRVGKSDTLVKILVAAGAEPWLAREMVEAARKLFPESALAPGQEVMITLVPSLTHLGRMEPARFSVLGDGHDHKVTVSRNAAGEFVASAEPPLARAVTSIDIEQQSDQQQPSNLYASLYYASLVQNVQPDTIMKILRIHAYETDFRRRLRAGDSVELFFDVKEEAGPDAAPGELLYTAITAGGETSRFYRFRTSDGHVDYYDDKGNNSKRFLMRRPVRGADVRLTSGFGQRFHPVLNERRMHTGVDWASPPGTPILAAGNGTIEEAGRKGQYGNYIRIRHANGYQTAYGHMSHFAPGVRDGIKVRQGQVIGYVGSTGLSSGPHVHFEVLVNNRFVDPMSIQVPRERQLTGKQLADFQKERARIDELMRRAPVITASK